MNKASLLLVIFISTSFLGRTQESIGDTIIVYIENRVELKVAINDFDQLRDSNQVVNDLKRFQAHFRSLENSFEPQEAELMIYFPDSIITIEKIAKKNFYLIQDGSPLNTGLRDKVIIHNKIAQISITTSDLNNLAEIDLDSCLNKAIALLPERTNLSKSLYFQCKQLEVSPLENRNNTNSDLGYIVLTAGAGASLYKNQWIGNFSLRVETLFRRKRAIDYFLYVTASLVYDFPSLDRTNINTFLSLGYRSSEVSPEFGYLISRQGNLFDKNTFRFGLSWSPINFISISSQMYFSDGFKKITPGIGINFGF